MPETSLAASDFNQPWRDKSKALVIDAYEYNSINWQKLVTNKRITGFINKASDGLSPIYAGRCRGNQTEKRLCKTLWKRFAVTKELYHTRKQVAKSMGLKWGAYHLGRPGNPIAQADHFLDFTKPDADDLLALDIEDNDPKKWLSLKDAERFARRIHQRIGRYPVLYTNGSTAQYIAANRDELPLLSRLPLWYARYKSNVGKHFPEGNWKRYDLWQFAANINCRKRSKCPYKTAGTPWDIDINVSTLTPDALRAAWPFNELVAPLPVASEPDFLYATADDLAPTEFEPIIMPEVVVAGLEQNLTIDRVPLPSRPPKKRRRAAPIIFADSVDFSNDAGIRYEINRQFIKAISPKKDMPLLSYAGLFQEAPEINIDGVDMGVDPVTSASIAAPFKLPLAALTPLAWPNEAPAQPEFALPVEALPTLALPISAPKYVEPVAYAP